MLPGTVWGGAEVSLLLRAGIGAFRYLLPSRSLLQIALAASIQSEKEAVD